MITPDEAVEKIRSAIDENEWSIKQLDFFIDDLVVLSDELKGV